MQSGSEKIGEAIKAVLALAARKEVGKAKQQELRDLTDQLSAIQAQIAEIEDLYAIDFGSDVDDQIRAAAELWAAAQPGRLADAALYPLRKMSPLLSTLFLKGLDIKSAFKFTDEEAEVAGWIGNRIDRAKDLLIGLRREQKAKGDIRDGEWSAMVPMDKSLAEIIAYLENKAVMRVGRLLAKNKDGRWVPIKREYLRDDRSQQVIVRYDKTNGRMLNMLHGTWLNSYVYGIIHNQLTRHQEHDGVPFELYTQIVYAAPADVIRSASDFDVIGRVRDTVICVECKSGRLDAARGDYQDLRGKTEDLRRVLGSIGSGEVKFLFFLVYDPEVNKEADVQREMESHHIRALKPTEVRSVMDRVLTEALK